MTISNNTLRRTQENNDWTQYWQTGADVSCVANADMESQLRYLWDGFVDGVPDKSRILDLATGNGFVALNCQARALASEKCLQIEAVDAADIMPNNKLEESNDVSSRVHFQGGVQLENLPFEDRFFSGVVSQFGFEYADEKQTISEISRVLAVNGQLCLIVHALHGAVSRDIHQRLQRLEAVLGKKGAVGLVLKLVRAVAAGDDKTVNDESKHLPTTMAMTRSLADDPMADDSALYYANEFLRLWNRRNQHSPSELLRSAEHGWLSASGTANRQRQMLHAACSEDDIKRISERFEAVGLTINPPKKVLDLRRNIQNSWMLVGKKN